jgi:hypothetical protein
MSSQSQSRLCSFWAPNRPLCASYVIEVRIDPCDQRITGTECIHLANRLPHPLGKLVLQTGMGAAGQIRLRGHGQALQTTPLLGDSEPPGARLVRVDLPDPLYPGAELELQIDFAGRLPDPQHGAWMLRDWHPRLWWGYPTCDDFEVRIDVPPEWQVAASGCTEGDPQLWRARRARAFGIVLRDDGDSAERESGAVRVRSLFTPGGRRCAELLLETAADAIDFYRGELGFYPQPFLSIVPGVREPMGGFPFATGIVAIHGQEQLDQRPRDFWRWITAHEIGHQYFGEHVLEGDAPGWLWIALGLSLDRDYARARGLDRAIHCGLLDRYLQGVREGVDTTVDRPPEQLASLSFDHNNIVVHGKGLAIISALEEVIGREVFQRVRARCLSEFAGKRLGAHPFQAICEEESGQDLEWFFDQWVRSNRHLAYRIAVIKRTHNAGWHSATVRVERAGTLEMPIPVQARFEDGSVQCAVTDRVLRVTELNFAGTSPVKEVVLDPDGALVLLDAPVRPLEAAEEEIARQIAAMPWTGSGAIAHQLLPRAQERELRSADLWAKLGMALYDGACYPEALEAFRQAAERSTDPTRRTGSWVWQGHLLDLLGRREEALRWYRKAQEVGFSDSLRHDQYGIELDARWIEERLRAPFERVDAETIGARKDR